MLGKSAQQDEFHREKSVRLGLDLGMHTETTAMRSPGAAPMVSLSWWMEQMGVTACTAWRWRKKGWLKVTKICGRLYLSAAAIAEFKERAERGEFAPGPKVPKNPNPVRGCGSV